MFTFAGRMKKTVILFLFSLLLTFVVGCTPSHYRLSFEEIDDMADYYPAQANVFLERTDSNDNKGYYKLLACKIRYQILGVYILRRDSDIEDAIQIFTKENNEPMLARALYYKGAMTFNTTHDTTQTLQILKQACRYSSIMRQKEKLDLYDLMCRITHDNSYTVKLEDEARQSHNISHRAWATLYRAVNNQDRQLAEEAFDIAYSISENKDSTLGPMYNYYFQKLIEQGNTPDSVIMDYINLADNYGGINYKTSVDLYRFLWRYGKTQKGEKFLNTYKPEIDELSNYMYLGAYEHLIPFYFVYLHLGDTTTADNIVKLIHQSEPVIERQGNANKEQKVKLMYEGGYSSYRYAQAKNWILVASIIVLAILLTMTYLSVSRIRKAQSTIAALHHSLHQLKDVENATLAERCEQLNHDIITQVRKLKRRDKDIELYKTQISELTDISQGLVYYSQAVQNKNISQIGKQGILQLLASYRMIDEKYSKRLVCYDLNPSHCLFCILYHIGKTDEEVMQILQYSMTNIRVRKSRIKADCEVYSFEAVISREV